jgi:hypothetical protein
MTATNHALSGALIGAFLPLPIAIPVAFASHFVLDALPHYGIPQNKRNSSKAYKYIVFFDTFFALCVAASAIIFHKWNMEIVGWVAYSPDATWVLQYYRQGKSMRLETRNWFTRFHRSIQRLERPWGIYVDLSVAAIMLPIFIQQLIK